MGKNNKEDELSEEEEEMEISEDVDEDELEDDDDEDDSGSEEEDSDDSDRPRKHRPFVPPPPREALPVRTTRGQNLGAVAAIQDDQADEEFWNQEFFAEEEADEIYATESEPEDNFDADFMESEEEESDGEGAEEDAKAREPKKKTLRPPGYKRPPPGKKPPPTTTEKASDGDQERGPSAPKRARRTSSDAAVEAGVPAERTVGVRESTRQKVQEGEDERKAVEASKPRRTSRPVVHRQLTQAELLAEAARTAIENTRSLQYLVMIEEETKKKANIKKGKYVGPMVRLHSAAVVGEDGEEKEEKTTIEVRNMQAPAYLQAQTLPAPPPKPVCVISGQPARYRDPTTGLAYADLAAFKELQARKQQQVAAQNQRQQAQNQYAVQQQQQLLLQQQQQQAAQMAMMQQRQAAFQQQQFLAQQAAQMAAAAAAGGGAPNPFLQ